MKTQDLINEIKKKAKKDLRNRQDPRFVTTMGFLVAKGFLQANIPLPHLPNKRLKIDDVIWAGVTVEPRILEVLPAAVLRLGNHFDLDAQKHPDLARIVQQLRKHQKEGDTFHEIPYAKLKVWADLALKDGRTKTHADKKLTKTFRLTPETVKTLKKLAQEMNCSETEVLERKILA